MAVKQLQNVYSFRKTGLTCHKWKANTTKLKGISEVDDLDEGVGEADDPNEADDLDEGVSEADDPNKGVGEADDPDEVVGEADDPDEGVGEVDDPDKGVGEADDPDKGVGKADDPDERVGEADDLDVAVLGFYTCIYKKISCAPHLLLIKKTPTRKGFRKILL